MEKSKINLEISNILISKKVIEQVIKECVSFEYLTGNITALEHSEVQCIDSKIKQFNIFLKSKPFT
jgi:hypothetical protein